MDWHRDWAPDGIEDAKATRSVLTYSVKLDEGESSLLFPHGAVHYAKAAGSTLCFHAQCYHKVILGDAHVRKLILHVGERHPNPDLDHAAYFPHAPTSLSYKHEERGGVSGEVVRYKPRGFGVSGSRLSSVSVVPAVLATPRPSVVADTSVSSESNNNNCGNTSSCSPLPPGTAQSGTSVTPRAILTYIPLAPASSPSGTTATPCLVQRAASQMCRGDRFYPPVYCRKARNRVPTFETGVLQK